MRLTKVMSSFRWLLAILAITGCSSEESGGGGPTNDLGQGSEQVTADAVARDSATGVDVAQDVSASETLTSRASPLEGAPCNPPTPALVITEIMIDPAKVADSAGEWFELHNPGATPINIKNWKLRSQGQTEHAVVADVIVQPGGYVVICRNSNSEQNGGVSNCAYQWSGMALANTSNDTVEVADPSGNTVDIVAWIATSTRHAPVGRSIALRHPFLYNDTIEFPTNPDDPQSWTNLNFSPSLVQYGQGDYGTPGEKNQDVWQVIEHADCNDNEICTYDLCEAGACHHEWKEGCCHGNADCNDGNRCTQDVCDLETNTCSNTPIPGCCVTNADCDDGNPCNYDYCFNYQCRFSSYNVVPGCCWAPDLDPETGQPWDPPSKKQAYADSQCDDKNPCTGPDYCDLPNHTCMSGPPVDNCCIVNADCDDGNGCTWDKCWENQCYHTQLDGCCAQDSDCNDNDPCTRDVCALGTCRFLFDPNQCCPSHAWCAANADDGNPCTDEKCLYDAQTGVKTCQHVYKPLCSVPCPYVETFDGASSFQSVGWKIYDFGTDAKKNWYIADTGSLGPDKHVLFSWNPTTVLVKSVDVSPLVDCSYGAANPWNVTRSAYVEWRMTYNHYQQGQPVTLKVVAADDGDYENGFVLWQVTTDQDIEYDIFHAPLPDFLKFSTRLQVGFMVQTNSTVYLDAWRIDDVKVASNVPNSLRKAQLWRCLDANCSNLNKGQSGLLSETVGGIPDITMSLSDHLVLQLCYEDVDGLDPAYMYFGFPYADLDPGGPLDKPGFVTPRTVSVGYWCQTLEHMVKAYCQDNQARFLCQIDLKPNNNDEYAGVHRIGIRAYDEWKGDGKFYNSPFESLAKATITVLLSDGYLVWAPLGANDPSALAIKSAIVAAGRKAQIVTRLDTIPDLSVYSGIFVTLGIYGRFHVLSESEAAILKNYLDNGGRVYLEGGEFFFTGDPQPETALHPYFKITGISDGSVKLDGPLAGRNFIWGIDLGYSQNPIFNAWNDRIAHTPGQGGREVLHNAGSKTFAVAVTYDSGTYRTIGSSILFGGLQNGPGGKTPQDLMDKYLYFLENGYPPCTQLEQCEDFEVCTEDKCVGNQCQNNPIPGCVPCVDDRDCGEDQACSLALGYCVDITCNGGVCPVKLVAGAGEVPKNFGLNPSTVTAKVSVAQPGLVSDLQVKAGVAHFYRGDVRLSLRGPDGTTVILKEANPADAKQNIYETYDIGVPVAPGQSLNAFDGRVLVGDWQLIAEDTNPLIYNGQLQSFRFYASFEAPTCNAASDCDDQNACTTEACVEGVCSWTPIDCDDGDPCTFDWCDPATGLCNHQGLPGLGCGCVRHSDCAPDEVCLGDATGIVCDPVNDVPNCHCQRICDISVYGSDCRKFVLSGGLPAAIPDANPNGVSKTISVSGETGVVRKAWVKVVTEHTAIGDLVARLCKGSTCVFLHYMSGGNEDGFYKVFEYDPSDGPGDMTFFKGLSLNGDWTLTITDTLAGDVGTWKEFTLYILRTGCYTKSDCNDNNLCTIDNCSVNGDEGSCEYSTVQCQPTGNPCKARECNPQNGQCELKNLPDGTSCEDGLYCTDDDTCQAGVCQGGAARDCSYLNGNCVVGVCDEALDSCKPQKLTNGEPCDAGEPCLAGDYCDANGECQQGNIPACPCTSDSDCQDDGDKCNGILGKCNLQTGFCELSEPPVDCYATNPPLPECKVYQCVPLTGQCIVKNAPNFSPCEDGLFCTVGDYCMSGECLPASARDCSYLDDKCVLGVCSEDQDTCVAQPKPNGTPCERDGMGCTIDKCDGAGNCIFDSNVDCSWMSVECNPAICQNLGWGSYECVPDPEPDGKPCSDDGNPCTDDTCQGGVCIHAIRDHCQTCGNNANEPCPCGGQHSFDAGDNTCGLKDSCVGGINGPDQGLCYPTCGDPANPVLPGTCIEAHSGVIDKPISEKNTPDTPNGCTTHKLTVTSSLQFVEQVLVKAEVYHTYLADLTVEVIDPQGYAHLIWNHIGFAEDNFFNTFDYSFPVPYPQIITSGVPMCSLRGEQISGDWFIRICDTGPGNGGYLHKWSLYFRGSNNPDLNPGHRCDDAIDLGNMDINPPQPFSGTTECSVNIIPMSGCGSSPGPDRVFKFSLTVPKRVTITLPQPTRDLVLYLKQPVDGTCDPVGSVACSNIAGAGGPPEVIDIQLLNPGMYYLGVDTVGSQFDYGPFTLTLRVRTLLEDGQPCVDPVLGPQDLDCLSGHCRNGYCCDPGPLGLNDCCPGGEWPVPPNGTDPNLIKSNPDWISAQAVCPDQYREDPVCDPYPEPDEGDFVNACQGHRYDANCVNHVCVKTYVDDDVACDNSVLSNRCGYFISEYCGDYGPVPPGAQEPPPCLTSCLQPGSSCTNHAQCGTNSRCVNGKCENDSYCDTNAHCDVDPQNPQNSICQADLPDGSACDENSDCESGHCQNGYCCQAGDCCPSNDVVGALACPASYTVPPTCSQTSTCDGQRKDPVCVNFMCGQITVQDDCACGGLVAFNCGMYVPQQCPFAPNPPDPDAPPGTCTQSPYPMPYDDPEKNAWESPKPQCPTSCLTNTSCTKHSDCPYGGCNLVAGKCEDDRMCLDIANCDPDPGNPANSICQADLPYGYPCDEDGDCKNYADPALNGHCQNGYCCLTGDCCAIDLGGSCDPQQYPYGCPNRMVCPTPNPPSGYWAPSVCDDQTTCQGHRVEAVCNATFTCGSVDVPDDSGCTSDMVANECGWYVSVYCNGQVEQTPPQCPTTCASDADCDPNAHCDPPPILAGCDEPGCAPNENLLQPQCVYPEGMWLCKFDYENHPPAEDGPGTICQPRKPNDWACNEASDCLSGYCQVHFCCDVGGCCRGCRVTGWVPTIGGGGTDDTTQGGQRVQSIWGQLSPGGSDQENSGNPKPRMNLGIYPTSVERYKGPPGSPAGGAVSE